MRTFLQLVCVLIACVLGLTSCSAGPGTRTSKKISSDKLSARPESGVFNVKHKGAQYEVSLETAETQAFEQLSSQETSFIVEASNQAVVCLLYTSPSPRDKRQSRMPSSA